MSKAHTMIWAPEDQLFKICDNLPRTADKWLFMHFTTIAQSSKAVQRHNLPNQNALPQSTTFSVCLKWSGHEIVAWAGYEKCILNICRLKTTMSNSQWECERKLSGNKQNNNNHSEGHTVFSMETGNGREATIMNVCLRHFTSAKITTTATCSCCLLRPDDRQFKCLLSPGPYLGVKLHFHW